MRVGDKGVVVKPHTTHQATPKPATHTEHASQPVRPRDGFEPGGQATRTAAAPSEAKPRSLFRRIADFLRRAPANANDLANKGGQAYVKGVQGQKDILEKIK